MVASMTSWLELLALLLDECGASAAEAAFVAFVEVVAVEVVADGCSKAAAVADAEEDDTAFSIMLAI